MAGFAPRDLDYARPWADDACALPAGSKARADDFDFSTLEGQKAFAEFLRDHARPAVGGERVSAKAGHR